MGPCVASLTRLTSLDLRGGVFAPASSHLRATLLLPASPNGGMGEGLVALTLGFGSEWWMHAGERLALGGCNGAGHKSLAHYEGLGC